MADVASVAKVSISTVSRALANSPVVSARTRERIQEIARSMGYRVNPIASSLRTRRSGIVCVAIPLMHAQKQQLSDPFMMRLIAALADQLSEHGYGLLLRKLTRHEDGWVERLLQIGHADGLIVIGQSDEHAALDAAASAGAAMVVWGARIPGQHYVSVGSDNHAGGRMAAEHLLARGRRRFAFVGDHRLPEIGERHRGYVQTLEARGIGIHEGHCVASGVDPESAEDAARRLLASDEPFDAVFAASDVIALSVIRVLTEAGIHVPEDVAVVGFDDIPPAALAKPALTSIRQDINRAAELLVERVIAAIGGARGESVAMRPELVVREST